MPPKKAATAAKPAPKAKTVKRKADKENPEPEQKEAEVVEKKTKPRAAKKEKVTATNEEPQQQPTRVTRKKAEPKAKEEAKKEAKATKVKKAKPVKAAKAPTPEPQDVEDEEEEAAAPEEPEVAPKGRKRRGAPAKAESKKSEPEGKQPKNATATDWKEIDFGCTTKNPRGNLPNFHITSWNVDGLRAWLKKGGLNIIEFDQPDVFCIQETKCSFDKLPDEITNIDGYETHWVGSDKEGYAGVGIASKIKPISVKFGIGAEEHDNEGRCITAEYEKFYLINVYVPNAGRKLITLPKRLAWNRLFKEYVKELDKLKPVIVCGDMNVAHEEIDLANPKTNTKNAGFTQQERDGMTDFLGDGYIDSFRKLYPDKEKAYTFWTYMANARTKNAGWRLDYFIVSERFMENVCDQIIHSKVLGSDHCPLSLHINL